MRAWHTRLQVSALPSCQRVCKEKLRSCFGVDAHVKSPSQHARAPHILRRSGLQEHPVRVCSRGKKRSTHTTCSLQISDLGRQTVPVLTGSRSKTLKEALPQTNLALDGQSSLYGCDFTTWSFDRLWTSPIPHYSSEITCLYQTDLVTSVRPEAPVKRPRM